MSSIFESTTGKVDYYFPEYDNPPHDPVRLGQKWLREAIDEKAREPKAMVLTTVNQSKIMSSRVMAILEFSDIGIIFATHQSSRKVRDSQEVPFACGHFYWKELGRQLSCSGKIKQLERTRAIAEWSKRPVPLHAMSTASHQSEPLISYEALLATAQKFSEMGPLPCPDRYAIYALEPIIIEFWSSCANRLHKRLRFELIEGSWHSTKLQP